MKNRQATINRIYPPCLILFLAAFELKDAGSGRGIIYIIPALVLLAVMVYNRFKIDLSEETPQLD